MAIPGTWTFYFSWGCTGNYLSTTVKIDPGGTYSEAGGTTGNWDSVGGYFALNFKGFPGGYSGNVQGSAMLGMMTTFSGSNGCWYAIQQGAGVTEAKADAKGRGFTGS